jgi:hypothetical protein
MKRPTERAARHTVVASIATALLLVFAGVGLSQVLVDGPQQGGSSLSTDTSTTGNGGQGNGTKVQICHMTGSKKKPGHTLWVAPTGAQAHLKQHKRDHMGPCTQEELHPTQTTASTQTATTSSTSKGKGKHKAKPKHQTKPSHGGGKKK